MSPRENPAAAHRADMRAWLEAAIFDAGAALPSAPPSSNASEVAAKAPIIHDTEPIDTGNIEAEHIEMEQTGTEHIVTDTVSHKRKLATVRRIAAITSVNKTYSAVAIDGWRVVVEGTEGFAKGDYVLFFEVDSFLPAHSEFEDLFAEAGPLITFDGAKGYRVGTSAWTDCRGIEIISQGHVCHLSDFPAIDQKVCDLHWEHIQLTEKDFAEFIRTIDFSDELGIKKWESFPEVGQAIPELDQSTPELGYTTPELDQTTPDVLTSNPKVPSFIIKTDTERVQNCPNLFIKPKYQRFLFQESLKMDGASATIYFIPYDSPLFTALPTLPGLTFANFPTFLKHATHVTGRFGVCTRNQDLLPHLLPSKTAPSHNHYWTAALAANLHAILAHLNEPIAIQAELVGATIQGNPYSYPTTATPNNPTHELFIFSITTPGPGQSSKRWHPRKVEAFAAEHGLKHVPVLGYHTVPSIARHHEDLIVRAELKKGEGLVFKNCVDGRWFKVLSSRWIREKGDEMHARAQAQAQAHLEAQAQGGGGRKRKGGMKMSKELEAERMAIAEKEVQAFKGWQMSPEQAKVLMDIFWNLDDWIRRDDGLRKWMEEWERGWHGGNWRATAGAQAEEANGAGNMENGWATKVEQIGEMRVMKGEAAGMSVTCGTGDHTAQDGQKAAGFGVPQEKRKELVDWLGIKQPTKNTPPVTSGKAAESGEKPNGFGVSKEKREELVGWLGIKKPTISTPPAAAGEAAESGQKPNGFGVQQEKSKDLADWLGIKWPAL